MASTFQKITDKLTGKSNKEHDESLTSNYGHHSDTTANTAGHTTGHGHTQTQGAYGTTGGTGIGGAGIGGTHGTGYTQDSHSTTTGPHSSNLANKLDPRVDNDGRSNPTSHTGGYTGAQTTGGYGSNTQSSTAAGPHSSGLANKLDPRVDSDMDGRNTMGSTHTGRAPIHDSTTHRAGGYETSSNTGPHSSGIGNKLDPRVDSNYDGQTNQGSYVGGYGNTQTSGIGGTHQGTHTGAHTGAHTGTHTGGYAAGGNTYDNQQSTTGPHSSNLLNKLDPRVDNNPDGRTSNTGGYGQTQSSTGYAGSNTHGYDNTSGMGGVGSHGHTGTNVGHNQQSTTTGPHSSNLLNKLDPRVDNDQSGRGNYGSNTGGYDQSNTGSGGVGRY